MSKLHKPAKTLIFAASISGFLSVVIATIVAHALTNQLEPHNLAVMHTALDYQRFYTLLALVAGLFTLFCPRKKPLSFILLLSGYIWLLGIICFSGGAYLIAYLQLSEFSLLMPLGGILFMVGWLFMLVVFKQQLHDST